MSNQRKDASTRDKSPDPVPSMLLGRQVWYKCAGTISQERVLWRDYLSKHTWWYQGSRIPKTEPKKPAFQLGEKAEIVNVYANGFFDIILTASGKLILRVHSREIRFVTTTVNPTWTELWEKDC